MPNHYSGTPQYAAILAGGVGTRLWPSSRRARPKQFADLTGSGSTMIQATAARLAGLVPPENLLVVTGSQYVPLVVEQLPFLSPQQIIGEPAGRNTAPAIGLAAIRVQRLNPNAVVISLHSDHVIPDQAAFQAALRRAAAAARDGYIATLGIVPTAPHTGYGYIERGQVLSTPVEDSPLPLYTVARFLEKPSLEVAEGFVAGGAHYWNAGIFVFRVDILLAEYARQLPALYHTLQEISALESRDLPPDQMRGAFEEAWSSVAAISFDHGIMEGAAKVAVVPLDAGWNDVGSWDALQDVVPAQDGDNLVVRGDLLSFDSSNNIVASDGALVVLVGVEDLVVVNTGDALLVGRKDHMQRVKEVVETLASKGHGSLL